MKSTTSRPALAFLALVSLGLYAGAATPKQNTTATDAKDSKASKEVKVETPEKEKDWSVKLAMPMWVAGLNGTTGVHGFNTHINVGAGKILQHAESLASFAGELHYKKFGVYTDFLFLHLQGTNYPGGLVQRADLNIKQYLADLDLSYRVIEGPKGWVDVLGGVRYTNLNESVATIPDIAAINAASETLVNNIAAQVKSDVQTAVSEQIDNRLGGLQPANSVVPVAPLAAPLRQPIHDAVVNAIEARRAELADAIAANDQARVNQIKADMTRTITAAVSNALYAQPTLKKQWFDPYIGVRARYNFNQAFYATAKADIGGFSVGSQLTWEAYAAFGCQITRNIYSEIGYQYLYVNYHSDDFLYKMSTGGAMLTVGVNF